MYVDNEDVTKVFQVISIPVQMFARNVNINVIYSKGNFLSSVNFCSINGTQKFNSMCEASSYQISPLYN
jgi:hypothetical protein